MTNIPRLKSSNIAFIFIDLQEKLLPKIFNAAQVTARSELLLRAANLLGLPYLTTTQYRKGLGEIVEPLRRVTDRPAFDKTTFSCVADDGISSELERHRRKFLVICGIETHICVMQTCLDLITGGFDVAIVADAMGARSELDHALGLKRMEAAGALPVTTEMLIYEVLGRSDSEMFKKILPLIKS